MPAVVTKCVIVLLLLLPLKLVVLPLEMTVADGWAALALPLCWIVLARQPRPVRLPYLPVFLLILFATVLASALSADPAAGIVAAFKDTYLYVWMLTLAAVLERVDARDYRALLIAWCAGAFLNAALIVAEFAHPPLLAALNGAVAGVDASQDSYRPSGLMINSNAAAFFQVLSFVPLIVLKPRPAILVPLIVLSTAAILGTGSLAAALALASGLAVGLVVVLIFSADTATVAGLVRRSLVAAGLSLAAMALLASAGPGLEEHLRSVSWGRGERSAEGRFEIWHRGSDTLLSDTPLWGLGPDRFRQIEGSEMHNDLLGFAVERGVLGLLGLCLLGAMAAVRGVNLFRLERARGRLRAAVFPAAVAATIATSMTHEVFHSRALWLVLALQEAALWRARRLDPA